MRNNLNSAFWGPKRVLDPSGGTQTVRLHLEGGKALEVSCGGVFVGR
jgi:hypothetical protein